jgi:hypothetical protein
MVCDAVRRRRRRDGYHPALGGRFQSFDQAVQQGHREPRPSRLAQPCEQIHLYEEERLVGRDRHALEPCLHQPPKLEAELPPPLELPPVEPPPPELPLEPLPPGASILGRPRVPRVGAVGSDGRGAASGIAAAPAPTARSLRLPRTFLSDMDLSRVIGAFAQVTRRRMCSGP